MSGSENSATGVLALYGLNAASFQSESAYGYYPIDAHRLIAIEVDGHQTGQQGVMLLEAMQSN